jgi:hypothetical protein
VSGAQPDPTEQELTDYVRYRLNQIAPTWAEPQFVDEAVTLQRDMWLMLYHIDRDMALGHFANPS